MRGSSNRLNVELGFDKWAVFLGSTSAIAHLKPLSAGLPFSLHRPVGSHLLLSSHPVDARCAYSMCHRSTLARMAVLTFSVCASMIARRRSIDSIVTESRRPSFMALAAWLRLRPIASN